MRLFVLVFFYSLSFAAFSHSGMRTFYVSSSTGDNNYDGSSHRPKKNIWSITGSIKSNIVIKLKRGDVFYENIHHLSNVRIEAYGKGEKPILCGFRVLRNPQAWESIGGGIWKLELNHDEYFEGFPRSLCTTGNCYNNFGCIYNPYHDRIYGHMVTSKEELNKDCDFFITNAYRKADITPNTFSSVLFKSLISPREMGKLCFSVFEHGISNIKKGIIKDIAIVGFARHGMCNLMNCEVNNCDLDIIGGAIQTGTSTFLRYGNGIEFWVSDPLQSGNTTIKNCTISRTYDCGTTIQGRKGRIYDVVFKKNKIIYCRQAFEHFISDKSLTSDYVRCRFSDNIVFEMGENQFSSPEKRDGNILSYGAPNKNLTISDNIFYGANHYDAQFFANDMKGNIVYIRPDQQLSWCHYITEIDAIPAEEGDKYKQRTGDSSKIVIVEKGTQKDLKIRKRLLRKINYHRHDLKIK